MTADHIATTEMWMLSSATAENGTTRGRRLIASAGIFLVAAAVISLRRYIQILHPDVWVEDGVLFLPAFASGGWWELFTPVHGYLLIPSKLVSFAGLTMSFSHFPEFATGFALVTQALCVTAVALAPTHLPAKFLCATAVVLVPSGTEVFLVSLYTFWWTTMLAFLALLWLPEARQYLRNTLLAIAGVSSPMIILLAPLFTIRAAVERSRSEITTAVMACLLAGLQLRALQHPSQGSVMGAMRHFDVVLAKYFGAPYLDISMTNATVMGLAVVVFLLSGIFLVPKNDRRPYILVGLALGAAVLSSVARVPVEAPHPLLAGPRYFFYPFILSAWMLIWMIARADRMVALAASFIVGAFVPMAVTNFFGVPWKPERPWEEQVRDCAASESYTFDIQYGLVGHTWKATLHGADCRRLIEDSWFK